MALAAFGPAAREVHDLGRGLALAPLKALQELLARVCGRGHGEGVVAVLLCDVGVDVDLRGGKDGARVEGVVLDGADGVSV